MPSNRFVLALAAALIFAPNLRATAQMSATDELKTLRVPEGFDVSLFASEPMITNPSAIDVDTRGRVWVAEIEWYRAKAKQPPADKIKVLEDTDGDGRADKVTVFAEGVFAPMSICVAGDKIYVATSPDLWVYEDKDGDLKPDGPPKKLLTGFGGFNHDHGAHSLVLGPDHKWWMAHGDTGFNVTGTDGSRIEYKWGAMLRGELDGSKLETVAVNFRNPYEVCVSSFGEAYFSDNDNDGNESVRVGWVIDGGNYGWFGSPPGPRGHVPSFVPFSEHWHFRGHIPGYVPATLVTGFGSPCGICFYEGDAFGPKYKNAPLHCDAGPREVRIYRHQLAGYGMSATSENIVTTAGDNYFRPDDICAAPDGSLYVSDWYDGGVGGHAYNDPDRGRIFRLTPKGKKPERVGKPGPYASADDAITGLRNPNLATQYLAREFFLHQDDRSIPILAQIAAADSDRNIRARALWLLDRIGSAGRKFVAQQLSSDDPAFRALAARILRRRADDDIKQLTTLVADSAPEVRRELLLAIPMIARVDAHGAWHALVQLAAEFDGQDRFQLEAIHIAAGKRKAELYSELDKAGKWSSQKIALMAVLDPDAAGRYLIAKLSDRTTTESDVKKLLDAAALAQSRDAMHAVLQMATGDSVDPALKLLALRRTDLGLSTGWRSFTGDPQLASAFKQLLADPATQSGILETAVKHGITALGPEAVRLATASELPVTARQNAIAAATRLKPQGISEVLSELLADPTPAIRDSSLSALVDMQDMKTLRAVLGGSNFSPAVQSQTVERLMTGTGGALVLLRMIESKSLATSLTPRVIALAAKHPDSNVRSLFEKLIPEADRPEKLGDAIKPENILSLKGDPKRGEQIFFQSSAAQCKNCHTVRGQGSNVGPDLSLIGKKYERATLLETILDPSKAIAPEYYTYLIETERGQVFAGFLAEKTGKQVVLKDARGELVRIPIAEVTDMVKSDKSVMPDLVLRDVTAQDAADLLAFLVTLQ